MQRPPPNRTASSYNYATRPPDNQAGAFFVYIGSAIILRQTKPGATYPPRQRYRHSVGREG